MTVLLYARASNDTTAVSPESGRREIGYRPRIANGSASSGLTVAADVAVAGSADIREAMVRAPAVRVRVLLKQCLVEAPQGDVENGRQSQSCPKQ